MRVVLALALLAVGCQALLSTSEYQRQFTNFVTHYNKKYDTTEFFNRFAIFCDNLDYINEENAKNLTYTLGVNEFSDLTHHEFQTAMLGKFPRSNNLVDVDDGMDVGLGDTVDWRAKGAVTPVKNQGSCGSCWAFSATGAIESWNFLQGTHQLIPLAEQQLVDCCRGSACGGSAGCNGGEETDAIIWVSKNGGQCKSTDYPYTAKDGSCKKTCTAAVKPNGAKRITGEADLIKGITMIPNTVAVDAGGRAWQSYKGGVFDTTCGKQLNHAILAVGYTDQYYIVKNSWGASWGAQGYIMMVRGKNMCGLALEPSYVI